MSHTVASHVAYGIDVLRWTAPSLLVQYRKKNKTATDYVPVRVASPPGGNYLVACPSCFRRGVFFLPFFGLPLLFVRHAIVVIIFGAFVYLFSFFFLIPVSFSSFAVFVFFLTLLSVYLVAGVPSTRDVFVCPRCIQYDASAVKRPGF